MTSPEAFINPKVLVWARARRNESQAELAHRANLSAERLAAWEGGESRPSIRQAEHLAATLQIPFGFLYLSSPPSDKLPIADFRGIARRTPSPDLLDVVNAAMLKQQWFREFVSGGGREPLPYVGKFRVPAGSVGAIAADIRSALRLGNLAAESSNQDEFFRQLVKACENVGILVMRSGIVGSNTHRKLDPGEFRGFSLSDAVAPVVFINAADWPAAQVFTLAHELCHIWAGQTGVSNEDIEQVRPPLGTEEFCNRVAAEVLIPAGDFAWAPAESAAANARRLARRFRVSAAVALRRALELRRISADEFRDALKQLAAAYRDVPRPEGGSFYPSLYARNGYTFTNTLVNAVAEGNALYSEAAHLLGVKVPTINGIIEGLRAGGQKGADRG